LSREYSSLPRQLIFPFLLRSSLLPLSCIRMITELIIVVFTVEYPKTKTTLRISIDIARYILVYGTSPQHSNLIFQMTVVQIRKKLCIRFMFLSSMRVQVTQKDLSLTFCLRFSTMNAKSISIWQKRVLQVYETISRKVVKWNVNFLFTIAFVEVFSLILIFNKHFRN
jgi:hypothetical protein